jgi:hypothetical protein
VVALIQARAAEAGSHQIKRTYRVNFPKRSITPTSAVEMVIKQKQDILYFFDYVNAQTNE